MRDPDLSIGSAVVLIAAFTLLAVTGAAGVRVSLVPAGARAQLAALPEFTDYPSVTAFSGAPAPVLIDSASYGRMFRARLRKGAQSGPNFAGAFTVVVWGCGSSCQLVAIVDARTGVLSEQTLRTTTGVDYRRDSRLIVADPVGAGDPPLDTCSACGTPAAYEWTGSRLEPVGPGPHPHTTGDRPW
jgi:hypothetical protein